MESSSLVLQDHSESGGRWRRPLKATTPERRVIAGVFLALSAMALLLRIFYSGHLFEDEGFWFTAAEEILRGKVLYHDIYFDKPPGLPLLYALVFKIAGPDIIAARVFTVLYSLAIAGVLYLFGKRAYDWRTGLLAAALFAFFSTANVTGHAQGMSTDFMMALPCTVAVGLFFLACRDFGNSGGSFRTGLLVSGLGGVAGGVGFQINPKAVYVLPLFAVLLIGFARSTGVRSGGRPGWFYAVGLLGLSCAGFVIGALPLAIYVGLSGSISDYWLSVWVWGKGYVDYYPLSESLLRGLRKTAGYLALNNLLAIGVLVAATAAIRYGATKRITGLIETADIDGFRADGGVLIWLGISYIAMATGGRFYDHYFFNILPAMCLIGARGLVMLKDNLRGRSAVLRRTVASAVIVGLAITLVRFHSRTALIALDSISGTMSASNEQWYYTRRNREERTAAAFVRGFRGEADAMSRRDPDEILANGGRVREVKSPSDLLFIWGYRPEVYYWSGLAPASRYLSTQILTGVPADVHYRAFDYRSVLDPSIARQERLKLARDLEQTLPEYILDELGMFNAALAITQFSEFENLMSKYRHAADLNGFRVYRNREYKKQRRIKEANPGQ